MALPEWPVTLPLPSPSYSGEVAGPAIHGNGERVLNTSRLRQKRTLFLTSVQWTFTDAEMKVFTWFFETTLNNGAKPFSIELIGGGVLEPVTVQFQGGTFSWSTDGGNNFSVSAKLFSSVSPRMTEEELDLLLSGVLETLEEFELAVAGLGVMLDEFLPSDTPDDFIDAVEALVAFLISIGTYP